MSDLISRQAAIDLLKQMRKDGDMVPWEGKNVFARIRELPAEPHWIPVTERLPESKEEDLEYPTVIIDLDGQVALGCYYESTREWGMGEYFNQKCFPIAWMPLPEAYHEEVTE